MPVRRWLCFGLDLHRDDRDSEVDSDGTDDDSEDDEGYHRLDSPSSPDDPSKPPASTKHPLHCGESDGVEDKNQELDNNNTQKPYTKADKKARKLSRKLRRKEKQARFGHLLHVTWKWCRRGFMAAVPSMGAMFNFAPSAPVSACSSVIYRRKNGGDKPGSTFA